jgi:hypothetical protein
MFRGEKFTYQMESEYFQNLGIYKRMHSIKFHDRQSPTILPSCEPLTAPN